jgi:hypothetical protein
LNSSCCKQTVVRTEVVAVSRSHNDAGGNQFLAMWAVVPAGGPIVPADIALRLLWHIQQLPPPTDLVRLLSRLTI